MTPRRAAVRALVAIERGATTLATETHRHRADLDDVRDQALFLELVAGTLRWRAALDAILQSRSRRPLADLDPAVRASLRIAAFQLRHLDRVPAHAIVHESVDIVRSYDHGRAAGFANGVLRALTRDDRPDVLPARPEPGASREAQLDYLSTTLSHPRWLVARWLDRHGFDATEQWCRFNNADPDVTIRPRRGTSTADVRTALDALGLPTEPGRFVASAIRLPPGVFRRLPAELRARVLVQDEGSQLVASVTGARTGDRVLDLCAAPGGKTLLLADSAGDGRVTASDYRPTRVALLRTMIAHSGHQVSIVRLDASGPLPFGPVFDRVLADVPCSGLGTLRRDPDVKWSRGEGDLSRLAVVERQILNRASEAVTVGGTLLYATCSSEPEENIDVVRSFLAENSQFTLAHPPPTPEIPDLRRLLDPHGCLSTRPFADGLDAYFAASLVRSRAT